MSAGSAWIMSGTRASAHDDGEGLANEHATQIPMRFEANGETEMRVRIAEWSSTPCRKTERLTIQEEYISRQGHGVRSVTAAGHPRDQERVRNRQTSAQTGGGEGDAEQDLRCWRFGPLAILAPLVSTHGRARPQTLGWLTVTVCSKDGSKHRAVPAMDIPYRFERLSRDSRGHAVCPALRPRFASRSDNAELETHGLSQ